MAADRETPRAPTDEEIVAYLDGQLDAERGAEIARTIATDPAVAAQADSLSIDADRLRGGMAALLAQAPEFAIPDTAPERRAAPAYRWAAAVLLAFGVGLGVGLGAGFLGPPPAGADWRQAVADYQVLYTSETVTGAPIPAATRQAGLDLVNDRLGMSFTQDQLEVAGLTFQRAQMLEFDGRPLAQLVFLDAARNPIAFCLMEREGAPEAAQDAQISGLNATHWADTRHQFIVIGPADRATIRDAARALKDQLPS